MLSVSLILVTCCVIIAHTEHLITKRSLLFPQFTILQFTYGVSAPALLPKRSINLSLCLQQNYELPYNISHFFPTVVMARQYEDYDYDLDRRTFYKFIVEMLNGIGLNGQVCLLRSICEIGEIPMHTETDNNNLLENIVHYLFRYVGHMWAQWQHEQYNKNFSPSEDYYQGEVMASNNNTESNIYLKAENWGKTYGKCYKKYYKCPLSIVSLFTKIFNI